MDLEALVESDEEAEDEVEEQQETVFPVKFVPALLQVRATSLLRASAMPLVNGLLAIPPLRTSCS